MSVDILMPALSPTMEEGTLAKWLVKEGDAVSSGDVIAEIETDKATMEVEAVDEGIVAKIMVAEGTEGVVVNAVIAVLAEDGAAVLGVLVAIAGIGLAQLTGDPRWDAAGSLMIGLLLGAVAIYLIRMNRSLLIGKVPPAQVTEKLRKVLDEDPVVESLNTFKAVVFGADSVRLSAEVEFHGEAIAQRLLAQAYDVPATWESLKSPEDLEALLLRFGDGVVEALGDEVDRLERALRAADPDARQVDLEVN